MFVTFTLNIVNIVIGFSRRASSFLAPLPIFVVYNPSWHTFHIISVFLAVWILSLLLAY